MNTVSIQVDSYFVLNVILIVLAVYVGRHIVKLHGKGYGYGQGAISNQLMTSRAFTY